jgi:hypothetical protein
LIIFAGINGNLTLNKPPLFKSSFLSLLFLLVFLGEPIATAQNEVAYPIPDSLILESHSPGKATLYSAVIPGMGQIYNKKYWKAPVVYAGFGVLVYFVIFNSTHYNEFKGGLLDFTDTIPGTSSYLNLISDKLDMSTIDPILYPDTFNPSSADWFESQLKNGMNYYRRNRDLSYIGMGLWYIINIIDATVDAHLFDYDVGEDLSLHIEPRIRRSPYSYETIGLKVTFQF